MRDINVMARVWAKKKNFACYLPTSSLFGSNVKNVFDEAIERTYNYRMEKMRENNTNSGRDGSQGRNDNASEGKKRRCVIF